MKIIKIHHHEDEVSAAFEFDNGDILFTTEGRGGFVVEGGLGYYDPSQWAEHIISMQNGRAYDGITGAIDEVREERIRKQMKVASELVDAELSHQESLPLINTEEGWNDELKEKAKKAFYKSLADTIS